MSRQLGSKNKEEVPPELAMSEAERLDYIAALIIELLEDEVTQDESPLPNRVPTGTPLTPKKSRSNGLLPIEA